ncbi:hypothetical protein PF006_g32897, partial [Phytophthora fragariae]
MFKRFSVDEHVGDFYRKMLDPAARERLTSNLARSLVNAPKPVQTRAIANFTKCDPHYGRRVQEKVAALTQQKKRTACPAKLNPPRKSFVAAPPSDNMAPRFSKAKTSQQRSVCSKVLEQYPDLEPYAEMLMPKKAPM